MENYVILRIRDKRFSLRVSGGLCFDGMRSLKDYCFEQKAWQNSYLSILILPYRLKISSWDYYWFKTNEWTVRTSAVCRHKSMLSGENGKFDIWICLLLITKFLQQRNNRKSLMVRIRKGNKRNHSLSLFTKSSLITLNKFSIRKGFLQNRL